MNNDELIAAGHELAKCLDSNTPLLDIAKMIVRLADKLDVTTLALRERAEPVGYADPQAFRNFQAGTANKEWMWAKPGAGLVPVFVEAPPAPVDAGWIACSERMPKIGDEIFYYCEDDGIRDCGIVGSSNFTGRGDPELFVHSEGFDLHLGADITQWMPLPAAPGKEG
ncbi:DUF551 domain-containing protein [Cronobacter sakazakii]|nr:DUF551 domain-containing protein [Cronobacter sakazakii]